MPPRDKLSGLYKPIEIHTPNIFSIIRWTGTSHLRKSTGGGGPRVAVSVWQGYLPERSGPLGVIPNDNYWNRFTRRKMRNKLPSSDFRVDNLKFIRQSMICMGLGNRKWQHGPLPF